MLSRLTRCLHRSPLGLTLLFAAGLFVSAPRPAAAIVLDRIAAVVNEEILLESEVNQAALQTARTELGDVDFATAEGQRKFEQHRKKTLESLIERLLTEVAALPYDEPDVESRLVFDGKNLL